MNTILNRRFVSFLAAGATLAMAALVGASSSTQVKELSPLVVPRTAHAATALSDGRSLITGGRDSAGNIVAVSEVFDPASETSTAGATLTTPRVDHTATLLADGKVLVAGGTGASGAVTSAEIFDPSNPTAGFRMLSATMGAARARHTATVLNDGKVLIAGGDDAGTAETSTAEIFDPATETFSSVLMAMAAPRIGHTATLFSDDSVLLAGGNTDSMELFTPADQKFTLDPQKMSAIRTGHEAIELSDTRLLFFEGDTGNTIDEFNHSTDTLTLKDTLTGSASSATLLANGKILVLRPDAAGLYAPDATDPTAAFTAFDETSVPGSSILMRSGQTVTELSSDKRVLVAGGVNALNLSVNPALFNAARIWTDKDDYLPGDNVILSGSGWKPNENVYLYAVDDTTEAWTYGSTVAADSNGGFVVNPYFVVQLVQLGANFSVSAVGAQSAMQAEVKFTDANIGTVTVAPSPSPNSGTVPPGGTATYLATVNFGGNATTCNTTLSVTGLPVGATAGWNGTAATTVTLAGGGGAQQTATLQISTTGATPPGTSTFTVNAAAGGGCTGGASSGTGTLVVFGAADHLAFLQQPTNRAAGASISPAVTVRVLDSGNRLVANSTASVGMAIGTNPSSGTLSGTTPVNAVNGVATFSNLSIDKIGTGYTLQATSSGLTSATSSAFNITPAAASKLVFGIQPSNTTAGVAISPAVTVQVQDQFGNPTASTAAVGIAILANPGSGILSGTTPVNAVSGTATFSNLSIDKGGVNYTVQAASTGLTSATSAQFTINNPAPTLASIAPASANLSDTLDVVFNGTNYITGVTTVNFGANMTVNTVTVNSSIKITANITIGSGAAVGARNVSVTNPAPGGGTASLTNAVTINNPATTTTLDSSLNPSTYGDSVTFTATVTSVSGTPTGSVTFYDSATCSGTVLAGPTTLDANGKAGFTTSSLTVPPHTITACYSSTRLYLARNGSVP